MTARAARTDDLLRVAEAAAGAMTAAAIDLTEIADHLSRRDKARRLHLERTAERLRLAAELLTAEVNAGPTTVRWMTRVGRAVVAAGTAGILGLTAGAGDGVGSTLTEHALAVHTEAKAWLDQLDQLAGDDVAGNDVLERVHSELLSLAALGGLGGHGHRVINDSRLADPQWLNQAPILAYQELFLAIDELQVALGGDLESLPPRQRQKREMELILVAEMRDQLGEWWTAAQPL